MIYIKNESEINSIRESCKIVAAVLDGIGEIIRPGISTFELNQKAEEIINKNFAESAFKGYQANGLAPFPFSICASINDEIVHGYSSKEKILNENDIIGIDVGVRKNGFYGDGARTFKVGNVDDEKKKLIEITKLAFENAFEKCEIGNRIGDISSTIEKTAKRNGLFVAENLTGHGVGIKLHEEPIIQNFGKSGTGPKLVEGMTIAIEPMFNLGTSKTIEDEWVFRTADNSNSAHYENTVLISKNGPEILTKTKGN